MFRVTVTMADGRRSSVDIRDLDRAVDMARDRFAESPGVRRVTVTLDDVEIWQADREGVKAGTTTTK